LGIKYQGQTKIIIIIIAGVDFISFAIEKSGVWGVQALKLVSEIGRRLTSTTHEPRSTFLRQRISVAVMRGNAQCVLGILSHPIVVMY